jgi:hypothetical protein
MEVCLFCNQPEPGYKSEIDFICGSCVVLLADADQADLKNAYQKALNEGYQRKVSALEFFIIPEGKIGKRPDKSVKRNFNRARASRPIRDKKGLSQSVEA